jgi:hypothetical protein
MIIPVEARAEPGMQIQFITGVKIEKATDDQEQRLSSAIEPDAEAYFHSGNVLRQVRIIRSVWANNGQIVPVRLKKADKASKVLKELSGILSAVVLLPPRPVITTDNILKAAGKTFKGKDNSSFVVKEVNSTEGRLNLVVEMEQIAYWPVVPANGVPVGPALPPIQKALPPLPAPQAGGALLFQQAAPIQGKPRIGGVIRPRPIPNVGNGGWDWSLQDNEGQEIPLTGFAVNCVQQMAGKNIMQFSLTFLLQKDQVPATFAYKSRRNVTLDIPFTLKDVCVP